MSVSVAAAAQLVQSHGSSFYPRWGLAYDITRPNKPRPQRCRDLRRQHTCTTEMSKGEKWFIIRHAVARGLCKTAAQEILSAVPEAERTGYLEYNPTPTCIQIANYISEVGVS